MIHTFNLKEGQRQMILLAIAELALSRPGWDTTLRELAEDFHGSQMYDAFKRANEDRVRVSRDPLERLPCLANEDTELLVWLQNAHAHAGDFLKNAAEAGLRADGENYPILRPALLELKRKYPKYADAAFPVNEVHS